MPYVIRNQNDSYMCYDANRKISATTNIKKAEIFSDAGKAYNVLNHCYPKSQRKSWSVSEVVACEQTKPGKQSVVRCSNMEASVRDSLKCGVDWSDVSKTLQEIYSSVLAYRTELQTELVRVESELCDCEHACEFFRFNAANGYKLYRMIRACRVNRRFLKDELRRVNVILDSSAASAASGKLQDEMRDIDTQVYTPRVLKELFNA